MTYTHTHPHNTRSSPLSHQRHLHLPVQDRRQRLLFHAPLLMFPAIAAVAKGSVAVTALVRPLPGVDALVPRHVAGARELARAHVARIDLGLALERRRRRVRQQHCRRRRRARSPATAPGNRRPHRLFLLRLSVVAATIIIVIIVVVVVVVVVVADVMDVGAVVDVILLAPAQTGPRTDAAADAAHAVVRAETTILVILAFRTGRDVVQRGIVNIVQ